MVSRLYAKNAGFYIIRWSRPTEGWQFHCAQYYDLKIARVDSHFETTPGLLLRSFKVDIVAQVLWDADGGKIHDNK